MKNQNEVVFVPDGSDLASRAQASRLRNKIENAVSSGKSAVVDLTEVISISESYADELFAVLVLNHDIEWFTNNIKLLHQSQSSAHVLLSIARAIRQRLANQDSQVIKVSVDKLIAARKAKHLTSSSHCLA